MHSNPASHKYHLLNQQLPPIILVSAWNLQHLQQQAHAFGSCPGCWFALSTASELKAATVGAAAWLLLGGPNSNDFAANHIIHHSVGLPDLKQQYR